ncbi:hypothetical protein [Nonlabens ulvanivorans]|uniref:hypothetical protein n=1 Tax=Nonlabens ulvanivorans TaxID=906888 RepID=UPI0037CAF8E0
MHEVHIYLDNPKTGIHHIARSFEHIDLSLNEDINVNVYHTRNYGINVEVFPILCSIINELRAKGTTVNLNFELPPGCHQLSYASRMDFLMTLGLEYEYNKKRHNGSSRFIEIQKVRPGAHGYDGDLAAVLQNNLKMTADEAYDPAFMLSELICNMGIHSNSENGAYIYCQGYPNRGLVEMHIADSGIGVTNSMRKNEKYKNSCDSDLLNLALQFGEGSGEGRGHGLYFVSEFLRRNKGYFHILSGSKGIIIDNGVESEYKIQNYQGTVIHLRIPIQCGIRVDAIMDEQGYEL